MKKKLRSIAASSIAALLLMPCASCSKSIEKKFQELQESERNSDDPLIFAAIRNGQSDLVEYMLKEHEPDLEYTDYFGNTPLLVTAEIGDVKMMKLLVAAGADLKASNRYGAPLVHVVAGKGHVVAMEFLIECGMDINERDLSGSFLSGSNGTSGFSAEVDRMIERTGGNPVDGEQPIHVAAREGNVEMVKFLIASGVDPVSKDANGKTPLDYVEMAGLTEKGDQPKDNRLAVVRLYNPSQQETPAAPATSGDLQERFFGK